MNLRNSITVYTNGISLFTLENYSPAAGACHVNDITIHATVGTLEKRAMHSNGALHYVYGVGDTVDLKGVPLKRGAKLGSFDVY